MNLFLLSLRPSLMAKGHSDKHIVKMLLEATQVLSNAYHWYMQAEEAPYRKTHAMHPVSVFVAQCSDNFHLVGRRLLAMCTEYTRRYGREHKCESIAVGMLTCPPDFTRRHPPVYANKDQALGAYGKYLVPLCMPAQFYHPNACVAYCNYYLQKLIDLPKCRQWRRRRDNVALVLYVRCLRARAL